ncbi:MAG: tyrosine-protein phosphatase [Chloroflexota bacterium]|nr:tyrosine-protein phosphatase [Chloroflexota bacterium]
MTSTAEPTANLELPSLSAPTGSPYDRHLPIIGTRNLRDIGGYPAGEGRQTRWRTVFRADCLDRLPDASQEALLDYGIRQVIDLRRLDELESYPNVFRESPRVRYVHIPLVDVDPYERAGSVAGMYRLYLDERRPQTAAVFRALLHPDGLPAVIHCAAGKDRTGVIIALLLAAVGVPNETIAEDYGFSQRCFSTRWEVITSDDGAGEIVAVLDNEAPVVECRPEAMLETLEHLNQTYGGAAEYLLASGLSQADLDRLWELLTEPAR